MSSRLEWVPATSLEPKLLTTELKMILRRRYTDNLHEIHIGKHEIPYWKGVLDGGCKDADLIIDALEAHGEIKLIESY